MAHKALDNLRREHSLKEVTVLITSNSSHSANTYSDNKQPVSNQPFEQALAQFKKSYNDLLDLSARYPVMQREQAGVCGVWSPREVLAHLCGWLAEARRRYQRFPRGASDMQYAVDAFNEVSVWQRRNHTWDAVVDELYARYEALLTMAEALTPEQRKRDNRYQNWLEALTRDCDAHVVQLNDVLAPHNQLDLTGK